MNYASYEDVKKIVTGMAKKIPQGIMEGNVPIGTIISYMGTTPPIDYLACDGTVYRISSYTELAEFIKNEFGSYNFFGGDGTTTFAVPDLRGEFLRGTGTNSHTNQGSGANVGVHQDGTAFPNIGNSSTALYASNTPSSSHNNSISNIDSAYKQDASGVGKNISFTGTWTDSNNNMILSRPTNTSVLYCIKYRNSTSAFEYINVGRFVAMSPVYYERNDLPTPNKTTITIHRSWINVDNYGYVLENDKVIDLTNADSWVIS